MTVHFAECAARIEWPDGARRLIGLDGMAIQIEPTMYRVGPHTIAAIDAAVDPAVVVRMPARSPEEIPQSTHRPKTTVLKRLLRRG
ncbi:hypothetical protein [Allorhizocola rhizosphaerae]|uniref:hypothetical protein n=1 Tax=Allorhizocola rhizosphaerae TaxID=1872709 RepID=UPI000E3EBEA9|nr:hypothetical protein [Allorhizocola rhizosphaerae]